MFGFEGRGLEFHHYIAFQARVIEEQVDEKLVARHLQAELPPDERKARTEFQQEARDVADQTVFDLALMRVITQAQKVEQVRVFERVVRQCRIRRRQASLKVGDRRALAQVQAVFDIQRQRAARPALLHRLFGVPGAIWCRIQLGQQGDDVEPRQLVSGLLTKLAVRAMLGKKPHVLEVAGRPAAHVRKRVLQVARQAVDHLGAPALARSSRRASTDRFALRPEKELVG